MKLVVFLSLLVTSTSFASVILNCDGTSGGSTVQDIAINGNTLKVTSRDSMNGMKFEATLDNTYKPRGASKKRYVGVDNGYRVEVIIPTNLLESAPRGYVQFRGNQDSFWSANYTCTKR